MHQMLVNRVNATDKYEAAIAMQPEAAHPVIAHTSRRSDRRNSDTSANRAGIDNKSEDEDDYESDSIKDRDIDNLRKLRTSQHPHTNN